jgi:uncharacterized SAM-binding protein YcdF (DUF218 family)
MLMVAGRQGGSALVRNRAMANPEAILVLASHEWERLPEAADRARSQPAAVVLLTVPSKIRNENCHLCNQREEWLAALGVESDRIRSLPQHVTNTRDEALSALAYCRNEKISRLLVITSPYHTRRALVTFEHVFAGSGVEIGIEAASAHSPAHPDRWWSTPYGRWYVRYEWAALAFYAVRYGIAP